MPSRNTGIVNEGLWIVSISDCLQSVAQEVPSGSPSFGNYFYFVKCWSHLDSLPTFCPAEFTSWRLELTLLHSVRISARSLSHRHLPSLLYLPVVYRDP